MIAAEAPAKINRELRVGSPRADGYHEVLSRIVSIDLADRLEAEEAPGWELRCDSPGMPPEGDNLVTMAAVALASATGVEARGRVRLEKRIPVGAGLGGGSSDAAAALALLSELWGVETDEAGRQALAASLGSDVAFFLSGGEARVQGRGEVVRPLPDAPPVDLILLLPPFSIPTAEVYRIHRKRGAGRLPERLELEDSQRFLGRNDLEPAVLELRPGMEAYLLSAREVASEAGITGSGSALVLAGADPDAEERLGRAHPEATLLRCRTLSREDYRQRVSPRRGGASWKSRK